MRVHEALDRVAEIRLVLDRAERFRGYRPEALALAGLLGMAAGQWQSSLLSTSAGATFIAYWVGIAVAAALIGGSATLWGYLLRDGDDQRRKTRQTLGQFVPCLVAGLLLTGAVWQSEVRDQLVPWLPGLWALLFGLGVFAARPFFPRAIGWVGLGFLLAGGWLLANATPELTRAGWRMGLVFGGGLLLIALVLQLNLVRERQEARDG